MAKTHAKKCIFDNKQSRFVCGGCARNNCTFILKLVKILNQSFRYDSMQLTIAPAALRHMTSCHNIEDSETYTISHVMRRNELTELVIDGPCKSCGETDCLCESMTRRILKKAFGKDSLFLFLPFELLKYVLANQGPEGRYRTHPCGTSPLRISYGGTKHDEVRRKLNELRYACYCDVYRTK